MSHKSTARYVAEGKLVLHLFISGMSPKSAEAIENVKKLCDEHLASEFELKIIDLYKNPEQAAAEGIVFSPSLVKKSPLPKRILVGTLSVTEKVIKALGLSLKEP